MRLKLISSIIILSLIFGSSNASAALFKYNEKKVTQGGYYFEMVYVGDGGKLRLQLESSDGVDLYISDEKDMEDISDFLRTGDGSFQKVHEESSLTSTDIELKKKGSGNLLILILYQFDPDSEQNGNDQVEFNLTLESLDGPERWTFDLSILLYIAIPLAVLLPVAFWIRRKV